MLQGCDFQRPLNDYYENAKRNFSKLNFDDLEYINLVPFFLCTRSLPRTGLILETPFNLHFLKEIT